MSTNADKILTAIDESLFPDKGGSYSIAKNHVLIVELEKQLGIPHGRKIFNRRDSILRVEELQLLAEKFLAGPKTPPVLAQLPAAPKTAGGIPRPHRSQLVEAANVLGIDCRGLDNDALFEACQAAALKAGVRFAGMADSEPGERCANPGMSAVRRAATQDMLAQIFKPAKR